ncbi:DUF504 domain-containing protein [Sulfolobaceae archaeon RB850M]|nr:DUF504 domain-containing protein [Sulfolobaceae archaeon]
MRIKDAINRVLWYEKDKDGFSIIIRDREKGSDEISFRRILRVDNTYIYLDDDTVIPLHRVIEIRYKGKLYWRRGE